MFYEMQDKDTPTYKIKSVPKANTFTITLKKEDGVSVAEGAMYGFRESINLGN